MKNNTDLMYKSFSPSTNNYSEFYVYNIYNTLVKSWNSQQSSEHFFPQSFRNNDVCAHGFLWRSYYLKNTFYISSELLEPLIQRVPLTNKKNLRKIKMTPSKIYCQKNKLSKPMPSICKDKNLQYALKQTNTLSTYNFTQ